MQMAKPVRRLHGEGWESIPLSATRCPPTPAAALPVHPLHTQSRVEFVGECALGAPQRFQADQGVGVILPPLSSPLFADGAKAVQGPALPFVENTKPEDLLATGHLLVPGHLTAAHLQELMAESAQGDLVWQNIFNDVAPWAGRPDDDEGRQVVYSTEGQRLAALESWATSLLATLDTVPGAEALHLGTAGYVRTAQATRQHLHRDLPLPADGEVAGMCGSMVQGP